MILGRHPENESAIEHHRQHESLSVFRKALLESAEFTALYPRTAADASDISFPSWEDLSAPRLVFVHSPKTGGTTFHDLLASLYAEDRVCPERFNGLKNHPAGMLAHYHLFSGHYDLVSCQLIPGEKQIVTFLREPVSRLISLYNFLKAHRPDVAERNEWVLAGLASDLDVADFFRHPLVTNHPYIRDGMTRALVDSLPIEIWPTVDEQQSLRDLSGAGREALGQLAGLAAFGVMERYEESIKLIFARLGIPRPHSIAHKMVLSDLIESEGNYRPIAVARESTELRSLIEELVPADLELYAGALELFEQRLRIARE
ncbi:sulfotransferase family 2 domain-containing protein [Pseudomonas sp. SO81]|uniref:sulfotransferase family 2 domain-containing protein n=1 Tax=Pseudomonas sp. SO81 TaxID=2983246 RepID=UPI0025A3EF50|nr:sulfotransferase family 2 domain-containing protein [Pseudomonas sp. SO81]WJN57200.1 hypothetical protein OH686_00545 [Pseudomonas sp. SO81]